MGDVLDSLIEVLSDLRSLSKHPDPNSTAADDLVKKIQGLINELAAHDDAAIRSLLMVVVSKLSSSPLHGS